MRERGRPQLVSLIVGFLTLPVAISNETTAGAPSMDPFATVYPPFGLLRLETGGVPADRILIA